MLSILVLNSKGGCGKTTLATNLAACYASRGLETTLVDYDAQGSSERWHRLRSRTRPGVHLVPAHRQASGATRTWQLTPPKGTRRVVIDAPAGLHALGLEDMVRRADVVLVPVLPSPIDIHAAADFLADVLLLRRVRERRTRPVVVANRVRENTVVYRKLEAFLSRLAVPFPARLRDSQHYVRAAEAGLGIHEMKGSGFAHERARWQPLIEWLDSVADASPRTVAGAHDGSGAA